MKFRKVFAISLVFIGLFQFAPSSFGFALLGPFASWMEETNGLRQPGDIGGPMDIGSGYRWNVPIVTYGFDQSFLDYFGTNGIAAVEGAIQILNDLPSASQIAPTNYPFDSQQVNYTAQAQNLCDLKSETLSLLLEQMGLTQPTRYIYVLRQWTPAFIPPSPNIYSSVFDWYPWAFPDFMVQRNFDPQTLDASTYVNGTIYYAYMSSQGNQNYIVPFATDPFANTYTAVADFILNPGGYYTGLTYDDVGGLRYLLSADNVNYEKLLPDVRTFGFHRNGIGNGTWRPGVEKITFARQPSDRWSRRFRPLSYHFTDVYLKNNVLMQQHAEREIRQPDFLFCAADNGENNPVTSWVIRTGTTSWLNYAALNGNTNGEGPGVIQPPIKITFHKLGPIVTTGDTGNPNFQPNTHNQSWGSFDDSTNSTVVYPALARNNTLFSIRLRFWVPGSTNAIGDVVYNTQLTNHTWHLKIPIGGLASLQISTNQIDWTSLATVMNSGSVFEWYHYDTDSPPKFFRVLQQSAPRH